VDHDNRSVSLVATLPAAHQPSVDDVNGAEVRAITRLIEMRMPDLPRLEIEMVVQRELRRFRDARVTRFIPILVERAALQYLRARATREEVSP